jgi:acyl transferase domain-containing protein/acyl carrier protein/nucleoside-diphosphate-sugar epimerase
MATSAITLSAGLDSDTLEMVLASVREFARTKLGDAVLLDLDARDEMPLDVVREMCGGELGIQLLFVPEEYGGMGGGAFDIYRVCEEMARIDLGVATGVLATFLGSDPIRVGGTPEQRRRWLTAIGEQGLLMAYAATEPEAGSDLAALRTTARPVVEEDRVVAYLLDGRKQWISNGGVADLYTVLANAPGGPSWFVVDRDTPGLTAGKPEDKHGIRASNTAAVYLDPGRWDPALYYGWPKRELDPERTGVILGNALAGEKHYVTAMRVSFPEFARDLVAAPTFAGLPAPARDAIVREMHASADGRLPVITEDTMPGELSNVIAGRVANVFDLHGPNYVCDAACASALAAINASVDELVDGHCDAVVTGGLDRNMNASAFVKFCKIGALSATGTRPYAEGADGFVMGEGAAIFLLKRLEDAERDGDRIYAVIRGLGGSSDGRGKGITAPNPIGQRLAVERAWRTAGLSPATAGLIEGHGTSTRVGDQVEVQALSEVLRGAGAPAGSIALGSVKSNIGHLKAAAGAAGVLKTVLALDHKLVPPSINCEHPSRDIDFAGSPLRVVTELREWEAPPGDVRRAGVSAFGFGGTNFHAVIEEYVPGRLDGSSRTFAVSAPEPAAAASKDPLRGAAVLGAGSGAELAGRLQALAAEARAGRAPAPRPPAEADLRAPERIAIDYGDAEELAARAELALKALASEPGAAAEAAWKALRSRGVFRGGGPAPRVAFLYTGQGSQYANMLGRLRGVEPIVRETFEEADRVMAPLLGRPLSELIFVDGADREAVSRAESTLRETEVTQPAVMAADLALTRLLAAYGVRPDMVMGHSLGEYGALMAAGSLTFEHTLEAVSARGHEMSHLSVADRGLMGAVFAPIEEIQQAAEAAGPGAVVANVNSTSQAVIGGSTPAVEQAMERLTATGRQVVPLPVSHAFHTSIVAPASEPLRRALVRLGLRPPALPIVSNVTGDFYPTGPDVLPQMLDLLGRQVAEPVQFLRGLRSLYEAGARVFVEVGPKRALQGFAEDVLGGRPGVVTLFTNHPKNGDLESFNQALCGLYAAGLGVGREAEPAAAPAPAPPPAAAPPAAAPPSTGSYTELGRLFAEFLAQHAAEVPGGASAEPVVITGAGLGLPGRERVFDDANVARILNGEQLIDEVPSRFRQAMLDHHVTRLVKRDGQDPTFEAIDDPDHVIRLAARGGALDLAEEFGVSAERVAALDRTSQLAIGAGIDALRDAGIPLVMHYRTTSVGSRLPERWVLPDSMRDDTGVIFASAFPGLDFLVGELDRYHRDRGRRDQLALLEHLRDRALGGLGGDAAELERRIHDLRAAIEREPYEFDRRFLFGVLSMGHSQFAELVGARGPNTQVNAACASTTQALALAEDWIRAGRCRRVVVIAGDDATSDALLGWVGSGFLASGAAATDDAVEHAALPFDRRRHGMLLGMGAAALVVESAEAARERGIRPICEQLGVVTANSAFHGTRLDVRHISQLMEDLIADAERRHGIERAAIAPETVFVSHETYTPARGGSAAAEVEALRGVFGQAADRIVVANTKGLTGHPLGVGIEDVVAVKALETGVVPPVPNFHEVDPELGMLNLSKGGAYPVRYALRLAAGFGSQISMALLRWVPAPDGSRPAVDELGHRRRIADRAAWQRWLAAAAGQPEAELEVVHRTLRVATPVPARPPATRPAPAVPAPTFAPPEPAPKRPEPAPAPAPPAPVPAAAPVEAPPPSPLPPAVEEDGVDGAVLGLVAEKTGYPEDMLELDLDLEADLGVDTVKQAELFATVRERYGIPRDDKLQLRDFPTLRHVIGFVRERSNGAAPVEAPHSSPPPPGESEASPPAVEEDEVEGAVLGLVAEKTGYPEDMLELDLDLEADLGVDTVKQAELFATVRERYGIPRDDKLQLRDFPTLRHVIGFVRERSSAAAPDEPLHPSPPPPAEREQEDARAVRGISAADQMPRRVPVPVLLPPIGLCRPTGVALARGDRVAIMADRGGVARALARRLEKRGVEVVPVEEPADLTGHRVRGVYWLPALDVEPAIEAMDHAAWTEALRLRVKRLHAAMRALGDQVGPAGTFLVSATRLGGLHGYGPDGATAPMGGAVTGFTKAFARERPDATVKAVDFETGRRPAEVADALIEETLADAGAVEVGRRGGERWTVGLADRPADGEGVRLGPDTIFAVTGAAGSIVAAIVADLAAACGGDFHLLDLTPEPDPSDPDLERFTSDREGLKRDLAERIRSAGERATPAMVERRLAALERSHAALSAFQAVRAAGGEARYHQVDLTDPEAVAAVMAEVRERHGRLDVLVHAAGLEISRLLPDKDEAQFALVLDVKCDGWHNLLRGAGDMPIGAVVAFSSIAGRFGNAGQTDYSAANDLLCKYASAFRRTRPETKAVAIDWTAWAGIGMATRGSIPKVMEAAGIEMLPPEFGIPTVRRELTASAGSGEVLVAGRLGVMGEERPSGLDAEAAVAAAGPMISRVLDMGIAGLRAEADLDPAVQPFLDHHRIDGTPVLPGVMGIEAFAELARLPLPGLVVAAVEDVSFLAPFKLYRDEPRTALLEARFEPDGDDVLARCGLVGERRLANRPDPQVTTHFEATVRLSAGPPAVPGPEPPPHGEEAAPEVVAADIYRVYFHGPAYRVLDRAWMDGGRVVGLAAADLPADHAPPDRPFLVQPRLIELCFQAAGVWELGAGGRLGLPARVDRVAVVPEPRSGALEAVVARAAGGEGFDVTVVDAEGRVHVRLDGYHTVPLPDGPGDELLAPFRAATGNAR